jgi:two-component system sensor histidine kinase KdpD
MSVLRADPLEGWRGYALAVGVTLLATGINALLIPYVAPTNLVMIYLLGVAYVASRCSPQAGALASVLSVAAFDFFFVHPSWTFAVADVQYIFTFAVMLAVSLLISTLTVRLREQSRARGDAAFKVQVEQMRGDLLSAVSHDLRTPLASIEGSAGVLLEQPELSEQSRQLAGTIQQESERMGRFVRDLLDMTRVQGAIELNLDWYGIDELLANAVLRTENLFQGAVQLHLPPTAPLVRVDGVLIEQVFVNLLENAARHAGAGVRVEIAVLPEAGHLRVDVCDDGPGIPAAMQEKVFERFQGVKGKGSGLGLAICRAAVEAHGGKIWAHLAKPRGMAISIRLPLEGELGDA